MRRDTLPHLMSSTIGSKGLPPEYDFYSKSPDHNLNTYELTSVASRQLCAPNNVYRDSFCTRLHSPYPRMPPEWEIIDLHHFLFPSGVSAASLHLSQGET